MSVIVKGGGGGKSSGLYVWKKYEVVPNPYLSFIGNEDFTLKTYNTTENWDYTLEYSTDTSTWNIWDGAKMIHTIGKCAIMGNNKFHWIIDKLVYFTTYADDNKTLGLTLAVTEENGVSTGKIYVGRTCVM